VSRPDLGNTNGRAPAGRLSIPPRIALQTRETSGADERHHLFGESLHLLELRTALQQQEIHTRRREFADAAADKHPTCPRNNTRRVLLSHLDGRCCWRDMTVVCSLLSLAAVATAS